jgi:DNA-binding ferritin-like protein (Dps family)
MYYGSITDGDTLVEMFGDLADLWERAAIDGTRICEIVGDDPVEFAETFARAYSGQQWIDKERARLRKAMADAEQEERQRSPSRASNGAGKATIIQNATRTELK